MFLQRHPKHEYNFHDDETLHDQTPETQSILAGLPQEVTAVGQLLVHGTGEEGKRAMIAKLPFNNELSKHFMAKGVKHYWGSMLHPPLSYRGDAFQYRSADGADNNILHPQLGKAGLPYAKSVPGKKGIHGARPDPGDLFDLLLARKDDTDSKSGISSMLLYHATIIIHDIFRTNADDKNISDTSSYLDLSPLYGIDKANQDSVRQHELGLLKPDSFAERRLLLQPPGVCIYLIMYNRFHNYVAKQLLEINENGKFSLPFPKDSDQWNNLAKEQQQGMKDKQDEDLFQTARLITCGLFINISIHDYLRVLMGFHAKDTPWTLDPRIDIPGTDDKTGIPRGVGNQVSVEFNLLYRFHSPISKRDRIWSEGFFKKYLSQFVGNGITEEQISTGEIPVPIFKEIIEKGNGKGKTREQKDRELKEKNQAPFTPPGLEIDDFERDRTGKVKLDANSRPIPTYKFKRDASGMFDDAQLVAEMVQVMEDPICQFGAQNVPKIFKAIEILGILQARKWELATLNEFREFFGLPKHKHFEDINNDPNITDALRSLYEDPDMVELYPGLVCEGTGRCLDPGTSGPNKGPTALWAGVFCDAVTLVRSDRFYTVDWNVGSLTSWGMHEVTSNPNILKGSVMHRLFQRAFPGYFKFNSIHLWQPFYTPAMNLKLAHEQKYLSQLDLSDLKLPEGIAKMNPSDPLFDVKFKRLKYEDLSRNVRRKLDVTIPVAAVAKPSTVTEISNYQEIKDNILGAHKAEFRNPGILDKDMITGKYLQAMMTSNSDTFDTAAKFLQKCFDDKERMLFDYFVGMSKEISDREKRKFQKFDLSAKFFSEEREKLQALKLSKNELADQQTKINDLEADYAKMPELSRKVDELSKKQQRTIQDRIDSYTQVYQIDVVKDYAIPIITRFVADFLGFWDSIKTPQHTSRKYSENQIYQHIHNCQNYQSYDSDETMIWERRLRFKESIGFLKERAEYGAHKAQQGFFGWFARGNSTTGDRPYTVKVREFGAEVTKELVKQLGDTEEAAAMMLIVALDAAHKTVLTFTEIIAYFIDHPHEKTPDVSNWIDIQNLAYNSKDSNALVLSPTSINTLKRYVLEAQRIRVNLPLQRIYTPANSSSTYSLPLTNSSTDTHTLRAGDQVLLNLQTAQQRSDVFPNPTSLTLDTRKRKLEDYLIYGLAASKPSPESTLKQTSLIGLTAMLSYLARLKDLRVAHDKLGRLKRAKTPAGVEGYLTPQWDQLVPFPTTWNLRFTGEGRGVFAGPDNADQGHGSNMVYQKPTETPGGGSYASGSGDAGTTPATVAPPSNGYPK